MLPSQGNVQNTQLRRDLKVDSSAAVSALPMHTESQLCFLCFMVSFEWFCHIWEPHGYPEASFSGPAKLGPLLMLLVSEWAPRVLIPAHLVNTDFDSINLACSSAVAWSASPLQFGKIPSVVAHFVQSSFYVDAVDVLEVMWSHWPHLCLSSLDESLP